jgi:GxxExxY protein
MSSDELAQTTMEVRVIDGILSSMGCERIVAARIVAAPSFSRRDAEEPSRRVNDLNNTTGIIVDTAFRIHSAVGPGLLESVYETILARDLAQRGLRVERQRSISFEYEGLWFEDACRADLIVEHSVIVEVKSAVAITAQFEKQLLTYLRLLDYRVGLLLNFGAPLMKEGIKRIANKL